MLENGVFITSCVPRMPTRPPRATWPPAYGLARPSAEASALASTVTVDRVDELSAAGVGVWAEAAIPWSAITAAMVTGRSGTEGNDMDLKECK